MARKFRKDRYVMAFVITLLIFLLGVLLGLVVENQRVSVITSQKAQQDIDMSSLQLQYQFIDQLASEGSCKAVSASFEKNINNLERTREQLDQYASDSSPISQQQFDNLKREYTLAQVRYWLLAKKAKEVCHRDIVSVLYFYTSQNTCQQCNNQGFILTYAKKKFGDSLLVFSFDADFTQEPLIDLMLRTYNVTSYPTIIIGNESYGFTGRDDLIRDLCANFRNNSNCEGINANATYAVNATLPVNGSSMQNSSGNSSPNQSSVPV